MVVDRLWLRAAPIIAIGLTFASPLHAQTDSGVSVDLDALDAGQALPTPLSAPAGRVILTPPPGANPISRPSTGPIKLKPPPSVKSAAAPTPPKMPAPERAAATRPKPDVAPPPQPAKPAAAPAAVAAAPAVTKSEPTAPAGPMAAAPPPAAVTPPPAPSPAPAPASAPAPSMAAAQTAATEPAGPANTALARDVAPPAPTTQQTASLPPPDQTPSQETIDSVSLMFAAGSANVSGEAQSKVGDLAQRMAGDRSLRVQLLAYASDPDKNTSKARRMALDRAVSVRNMLIDAGVERTRIEVRALGDQGDSGPADRVDAIAVKR